MKGVGVLALTYASDVVCLPNPLLKTFDAYQRRLGRLALCANSYTAIEAIQGYMGRSNFGFRVDCNKLKYLGWVYHLAK